MKPIRGERTRNLARDPWDQRDREQDRADTLHVLGDDGGVESYRTANRRACDCGCLAPIAGFCSRCGASACSGLSGAAPCFGRCLNCSAPLCPRCSFFFAAPDRARLCRGCAGAAARRRRWRSLGAALLSPFVEFESDARQ